MSGLHNQDRNLRILSDLSVLATLRSGQTLSTSTMTVIDHTAWSSTLWRKYAGENRKDTIGFVRGIFTEALSICDLSPSKEILSNIEPALKGFSSLKDTYKGDYYTIAEIDRIVTDIRNKLPPLWEKLNSQPQPEFEPILENFNNEEISHEPTLEECVEELVRTKLLNTTPTNVSQQISSESLEFSELDSNTYTNQNTVPTELNILENMINHEIDSLNPSIDSDQLAAQKISSAPSTIFSDSTETSHSETLVSISNRECAEETTDSSVSIGGPISCPENSSSIFTILDLPLINTLAQLSSVPSDNKEQLPYVNHEDSNNNPPEKHTDKSIEYFPIISLNSSTTILITEDTEIPKDTTEIPKDTTEISNDAIHTSEDTIDASEEIEEVSEDTTQIPEKIEQIPEKIEQIPEKIEQIPEKIEGILEKIEQIPEKIEGIPEKIEGIPEKIEGIPEKIEEISEKKEEIPEKNEEIPEKIEEISEKIEEISEKIEEIPEKKEEIPEKIEEISETKKESEDEKLKPVRVVVEDNVEVSNMVRATSEELVSKRKDEERTNFSDEEGLLLVDRFVQKVQPEKLDIELEEFQKEISVMPLSPDMNECIGGLTQRRVSDQLTKNRLCESNDESEDLSLENTESDYFIKKIQKTRSSTIDQQHGEIVGPELSEHNNTEQCVPAEQTDHYGRNYTSRSDGSAKDYVCPALSDLDPVSGPKWNVMESPSDISITISDESTISLWPNTASNGTILVCKEPSFYAEYDIESGGEYVSDWRADVAQSTKSPILNTEEHKFICPDCFKSVDSGDKGCPAVKRNITTERRRTTGTSEEVDSTPPIIRLAKAFKQWIDSIGDCDENSQEDNGIMAQNSIMSI